MNRRSGWWQGLASGVLASFVCIIGATPAYAVPTAAQVREPVLLVVDTSGSMGDQDGTGIVKIEGAKTALLELLDALPLDSEIGLRTYPAATSDCGSGRLAFPVAQRAPASMAADIRALSANGDTPTAEALQAAADDVRSAGYTSATIVLVSDGESTCGDPCQVAKQLSNQGLQVTVNTVGFRIEQTGAQELLCIAEATGGTYVDVSDSAALAAQLTALNAAELKLTLDYPEVFSPTSATTLSIEATITNESAVEALDLRASIVFDPAATGGSPTVLRPLRTLGNLTAQGTTTTTWLVYPSRIRGVGNLDFTVTIYSRGAMPLTLTGSVRLSDDLNTDAAGPLLQGVEHVVVLGDSYSSGEGGGSYDAEGGLCHRSSNTYAVQLFGADRVTNLACSGAVIADHTQRQGSRDVASQQDQLDDLDEIDLVLLTMGGNDIGFADIIQNCLYGVACDSALVCVVSPVPVKAILQLCSPDRLTSGPLFWEWRLGNLRTSLETYYGQVLAGTRDAPVVVLPYVNVVPNTGRGLFSCLEGLPGVDSIEMDLVRWLQDELNSQIEQAVTAAQESPGGYRLYYADDVATAVQPNHTLCDEDRWINGLTDRGLSGVIDGSQRQELVHPTQAGYRSEAGALLRWSTSAEAQPSSSTVQTTLEASSAAADFFDWTYRLLTSPAPHALGGSTGVSEHNAGAQVAVTAGGFAPGGEVTLAIASTAQTLATVRANQDGDIRAEIQLPASMSTGTHTLFASGFATDGSYTVAGITIITTRPPAQAPLILIGVAALMIPLGFILIRLGHRRLTRHRLSKVTTRRPHALPIGSGT